MIGVAEAEKFGALRISYVSEVLEGDFERDLDGGGAAVGEEGPAEAWRRDLSEATSELIGERISQTEERGVRDSIELSPDGVIDFLTSVTMNIAPEGRDSVEVGCSLIIKERRTMPADDRWR